MLYVVESLTPSLLPDKPFILKASPVALEQAESYMRSYKRIYTNIDWKRMKKILKHISEDFDFDRYNYYKHGELEEEPDYPLDVCDLEGKLKEYDMIIMLVFDENSEVPSQAFLMQVEFFLKDPPDDDCFIV